MNFESLRVPPDTKVKMKDFKTDYTGPFNNKSEAQEKLQADVLTLAEYQAKLYAQNTAGLLVILQGIDAAGKDSTIKHVMSGVNPSGCEVKSFKVPSVEELDHDYMWRYNRAMPARGMIGIFNRSYYEEVLVVRVHPDLLANERISSAKKQAKLWQTRYRDINALERYLVENNIEIVKFFLNLSKAEQKARFLKRLDQEDKNWKFSESDVKERAFWDDYQVAFEEMLSNTSTEHAPWYVIPADHKWFSRVAVADIINRKLASMDLSFPKLDELQLKSLEKARSILESEK